MYVMYYPTKLEPCCCDLKVYSLLGDISFCVNVSCLYNLTESAIDMSAAQIGMILT